MKICLQIFLADPELSQKRIILVSACYPLRKNRSKSYRRARYLWERSLHGTDTQQQRLQDPRIHRQHQSHRQLPDRARRQGHSKYVIKIIFIVSYY